MAKVTKATSPSKAIQHGVDTAWGANKGTTKPKEALGQKHTNKPIPVSGQK
jgi:hypothetical protein